MQTRQVCCPSCKLLLDIPPGMANCVVRCSRCKARFRLPKRIAVTEDAIANWIGPVARKLRPHEIDDDNLELVPEDHLEEEVELSQSIKHVDPGDMDSLRLIKYDGAGAIIEFPASRLKELNFRCSMPRRCLRCGTHTHLIAHAIVFSTQFVDDMSLEAEHKAGGLMLNEDEVRKLTGQELLDRMPLVPNVPPPGNLPMPYWVCDMCSKAGLISGQISVNSETGNGWCRLRIRNLRRSEEFLLTAGGPDTPGYHDLHKHLETVTEMPWENLSSTVQHRIEQWYKPRYGEQFIAYIPDRDHVRTEDGMNGMLVTYQRLIYHVSIRHYETRQGEPISLKLSTETTKGVVQIETPRFKVKHFTVDRDGLTLLRVSLTSAKFKPVWK